MTLREQEVFSITIITYQGAKALGFSDDYNSEFQDKIELILDQGDFGNITEREQQKRREAVKSEISKGKLDSKIMMDEYEWDYLIMDEAHNANKIFMQVKGQMKEDGKRENSRYSFANGSGQPSLLGKKMFFLSQYVQQMSNGLGNVNLLTATPFTNNPLNVYNIFALANFERLKQYGIGNVQKFFDEYVDVTYENVVTSKGGIESKQVIKGWKNKIALQKILFSIINYKSAADSPFVKRPIKFTLPLFNEMVDGQMLPLPKEKQISTILKPTPRQKLNQTEISNWLQAQLKDKELMKLAPHLVADIMSCKNTLSPHVYEQIDPTTIDPVEFIEASPKLLAMTTAIKKTNEWFDSRKAARSGQIIYINGGIEYMPLLKKYLIDYLGYKTNVIEVGKNKYLDEVEILAGDSITDELKEDVKNGFNDGLIKVVIGSSTIREGIDLQMRTSDLHNLWIDWNPTDYKQLEGRLWRFGNKFDYVRIISYLLSGGSDAFKFQKLEEKTARINDIFDRANKSNILEVTEEDREAVKWALIDDVTIIAKEKIKQEAEVLRKEIKVNKETIEKYESFTRIINDLSNKEKYLESMIQTIVDNADKLELPLLKTDIPLLEKLQIIKRNSKKISESDLDYYSKQRLNDWNFTYKVRDYQDNIKQIHNLNEKTKKEKGVSVFDIETTVLIAELEQKNILIEEQITELTSEENISRLSNELQAEKEKVEGDALTPEKVAERIASLNDTVLKVLSAETVIQTIKDPEKSKQKIEIVNQTAIPIEEAVKNNEFTIPLKSIVGKGLNPSISVKFIDKKHTENPIWFSQINLSNIQLAAKMTVSGQKPSQRNIDEYEGVKTAIENGYKWIYMLAGKYGGIYILVKDYNNVYNTGDVLTKNGFEKLSKSSGNEIKLEDILNDPILDEINDSSKEFSITYKNWTITKKENNTFEVRNPKGFIEFETNNKGTLEESKEWVDKFDKFSSPKAKASKIDQEIKSKLENEKPHTQKLIDTLVKYGERKIGDETINSEGVKYRYDTVKYKNKTVPNWLNVLFERASKELTGKSFFSQFKYEKSPEKEYTFYIRKPSSKGLPNEDASFSELVILDNVNEKYSSKPNTIPLKDKPRQKEVEIETEFIAKNDDTQELIQLISYDEKPLSDQLKAVTGEPFTDNYKLEGDVYTHLPTGKRFRVPFDRQIKSSQIEKGLKVEQEHKHTLEQIAKGKITVKQAIEKTVEDHLKEDPDYYTKLEKIEGKSSEIQQAIEALELTQEFTDDSNKFKEIAEAIEALKITLEYI